MRMLTLLLLYTPALWASDLCYSLGGETKVVDHKDAGFPAWSPDGTELAFSSSAGEAGRRNIFVLSISSGELRRVTASASLDDHPTWSPSGQEIAFVSDRTGVWRLHVTDSDGTKPSREVEGGISGATDYQPAWSPSGEEIAVVSDRLGATRVVSVHLTTGAVTEWSGGEPWLEDPAWSPDGRHLVASGSGLSTFGEPEGRLYKLSRDGAPPQLLRSNLGGVRRTAVDN